MKQFIIFVVMTYFSEIRTELNYKIIKIEKCTGDNEYIKMEKCEKVNENVINMRFNYLQAVDYSLVRLLCFSFHYIHIEIVHLGTVHK